MQGCDLFESALLLLVVRMHRQCPIPGSEGGLDIAEHRCLPREEQITSVVGN